MVTDLTMGGGDFAAPDWAKLNFLERFEPDLSKLTPEERQKAVLTRLKTEITSLKQEKAEFAAELEKAKTLLDLQKDIERENTVYFE